MKSEDAENLFVMADGTNATSQQLSKGDDGILRNKSGVKVALGADGKPLTVAQAAAEGGNEAAARAGKPDEGNANPQPKPDKGAPLMTTQNTQSRPAPASGSTSER